MIRDENKFQIATSSLSDHNTVLSDIIDCCSDIAIAIGIANTQLLCFFFHLFHP